MENSNYQTFKQLHRENTPFLLPNAWDARSAKIFQENGFKAVATSSAAVANALGYEDGEQLPFDELAFVVRRIIAGTDLLVLSVDIEGGYSRDAAEVCDHIYQLASMGVAGINLEDSVVIDGTRQLLDANETAAQISKIRAYCASRGIEIFLNLRTDTYLLNVENHVEQTLGRIELYQEAGADGIFIPCLTCLDEMKVFCQQTALPVNVMCMPDLPDFDALKEAGVRRITMGPFMFEYLAKQQAAACSEIQHIGNFTPLFETHRDTSRMEIK
jgi:2-methylisocitrate lyase-like PEP mutase family enzyme